MADIVPFVRKSPVLEPAQGDPAAEGWLQGEASCLACGHCWQAVTPRGASVNCPDGETGLECPECGSFKGYLRRFVVYQDCENWHCGTCRNSHIFSVILAKGGVPCLSCASCGALSNLLDCFNPKC